MSMMALIQNGALCLMSRWRMQQKLLPACMGRRTQLAKVDIKSAYQNSTVSSRRKITARLAVGRTSFS